MKSMKKLEHKHNAYLPCLTFHIFFSKVKKQKVPYNYYLEQELSVLYLEPRVHLRYGRCMLCPGGLTIHNVDTGQYKFHQNMKKNEVMVIKEVEEQIMLWKKVQELECCDQIN